MSLASSAAGVDVEVLARLMVNEYAMVKDTYNVQKSEPYTIIGDKIGDAKAERSDRRKSESDIQGRMTLKWKWFGFDSKEDEVVPRVKDVSLVDGVFEGAFSGDGDDDFAIGECSMDCP
ncbi:hypothetical protein Tco_0947291 [Tanacetum coccineum]